ncbi:hypothetical protein FQY83_07180 [Luteimonas marina]|uniref:Uncharacterized protein n=1 Tax=Luteimonas marina TaxID=488485 RepID=A0A5C5U6Q7_9GAMM|nr:hypothetical protein FQY83_07180 [Luteimonas marina]
MGRWRCPSTSTSRSGGGWRRRPGEFRGRAQGRHSLQGRHPREGGDPVSLFFKVLKTLGPRLRGDDDFWIHWQ